MEMNDGPEQDWHDGSDGTGPPGGNAGAKQGGRGWSFLLLGKSKKIIFIPVYLIIKKSIYKKVC